MMTASTLFLRSAISCTADWDRSVGIAATRLIDPVGKVSPGTGKADPFPRDHSPIATLQRVREISFFGICQKLREKDCRRHRRKNGFALLDHGEKAILVGSNELREVLAMRSLCRGVCGGYTESIDLTWCVSQLVTQCGRRIVQEGAFQKEICTMTVRQLHLSGDVFRNAGIHSPWARPFRRNQAPNSR